MFLMKLIELTPSLNSIKIGGFPDFFVLILKIENKTKQKKKKN
jgi:hypothetical protein